MRYGFLAPARLLTVAVLLAACAGAPPASRPASKPAAEPELEKSERLCNQQARALFFDKIGVPAGEQAVDLAFDERHVWVLFRPSRLLQVDRGTATGKVEVRMLNGTVGESWSAITLDPRDGSLWIAAAPFHFKRVTPELRVETVRLPQIQGEGTFAQIALTAEEIYARPLVAEHELWRFDRTGKLLGDAFPRAGDEAAPAAIREVLEECAGAGQLGLLAVRADDRGYAAITEAALIQGSFEVP